MSKCKCLKSTRMKDMTVSFYLLNPIKLKPILELVYFSQSCNLFTNHMGPEEDCLDKWFYFLEILSKNMLEFTENIIFELSNRIFVSTQFFNIHFCIISYQHKQRKYNKLLDKCSKLIPLLRSDSHVQVFAELFSGSVKTHNACWKMKRLYCKWLECWQKEAEKKKMHIFVTEVIKNSCFSMSVPYD